MRTALTIAGTDPSGGAGIQADLKTMTAHRVYGMSAITAVVAQNTTGVTGIMEVTPEFLAEQLDDVFTGCGEDRYGFVQRSDQSDCRKTETVPREEYRPRPCHGSDGGIEADQRRGHIHAEGSADSAGGCNHTQYSGDGSVIRYDDSDR